MATVDGPKYMGPYVFDLTAVKDHLVDLAPGALKGIRGEQPGIDKVYLELAEAVPKHGEAADIPLQVYQRIIARTQTMAAVRAKEIELEKGLEICRESRAKLENDQQDDIGIIAKAAQDTAHRKKDPGVAAPFAETIRYNAQIAEKAVRTRNKNAEAKAEAEKEAPPKP
ncbi:hypothetical protein L0Y59_04375, partial [Candidatus Uhrbacteria bacterium]|nr:hypothetical protein [Candidatus Uhrbacteria bacterium]